ncbi:MAG TPA: DCC1-like thiol-disulfide oxidoreductase family protein [Bacteroidia bacterium]
MKEGIEYNGIVLFDGVCNFCDASIQFIINREKHPALHFASLQSETGKHLMQKYGIDASTTDSVVFIVKNKAHTKSSAALHLCKRLKGLYPLLFAFIIVPPFIRNAVYDWVARNRYKWYGKKDACMIPTPEVRARFVDL